MFNQHRDELVPLPPPHIPNDNLHAFDNVDISARTYWLLSWSLPNTNKLICKKVRFETATDALIKSKIIHRSYGLIRNTRLIEKRRGLRLSHCAINRISHQVCFLSLLIYLSRTRGWCENAAGSVKAERSLETQVVLRVRYVLMWLKVTASADSRFSELNGTRTTTMTCLRRSSNCCRRLCHVSNFILVAIQRNIYLIRNAFYP